MSKTKNYSLFASVLKGALLSVFCTVVGVLIFSFIVKISSLSENAIKSVNQFIKIISVFLGCLFFVKENKGLVKGLLLGVFYAVLVSLVFKLLGGGYQTFLSFIIDLVFCTVIGIISGIISVNAKNR